MNDTRSQFSIMNDILNDKSHNLDKNHNLIISDIMNECCS